MSAGRRRSKRGAVFNLALLPDREDEPATDWSVVNFRELYTLPRDIITRHVAFQRERLRLTPPHREAIAQSFARYFMRVAVEDDLQRFRGWSPPA